MKKTIILFFTIFIFSALFFSSCKKCTTCHIERLDGTIEAEYDEFCGTKSEIDDYKKELDAKAEQLGGVGKTVCVDN